MCVDVLSEISKCQLYKEKLDKLFQRQNEHTTKSNCIQYNTLFNHTKAVCDDVKQFLYDLDILLTSGSDFLRLSHSKIQVLKDRTYNVIKESYITLQLNVFVYLEISFPIYIQMLSMNQKQKN